ncbi:hypothetical protein ABVT39_005890 [Epinephelus coioides]
MSSLAQERRSGVQLLSAALLPLLLLSLSGCSGMDVLMPSNINALNGSTIKIPCTFTSCYRMDATKFAMNWTYQETLNDTEVMFMTFHKKKGMVPLRSERFGDRVTFAGNLDKNDLSITLSDVQLEDEGIYNCYVKNPPDRIQGHGVIQLNVVTELPPPRDSTIAVAIGASVGGALALLILSMVVVKCLRRHRKQELISEEKMEEEGKLEADGVAEEGTNYAVLSRSELARGWNPGRIRQVTGNTRVPSIAEVHSGRLMLSVIHTHRLADIKQITASFKLPSNSMRPYKAARQTVRLRASNTKSPPRGRLHVLHSRYPSKGDWIVPALTPLREIGSCISHREMGLGRGPVEL